MSLPIALLGAAMTHGAHVITGSPDHYVNGLPVTRIGDLVYCPLNGHGVNPIVAVQTTTDSSGGKLIATVNAVAACGAVVVTGSTNSYGG